MLLNRCRLKAAHLCLSSYNSFSNYWTLPGVSKSCQEVSKLWPWHQKLCASRLHFLTAPHALHSVGRWWTYFFFRTGFSDKLVMYIFSRGSKLITCQGKAETGVLGWVSHLISAFTSRRTRFSEFWFNSLFSNPHLKLHLLG